jgi:hypothetical protein
LALQKVNGALAKAGAPFCFSRGTSDVELVAIVIVVIPITIGMPAVAVFIPPPMPLIPTALASLMQLVTPVVGLPAIPAVVLHSFMQFVVCFGDAALAAVIIFRRRPGRSRECQHANECCGS